MYPELTKAIKNKYGTEAAMARSVGWSKQRLFNLTHGKKKPDIDDLNAISEGLGLPIQTVFNFFMA